MINDSTITKAKEHTHKLILIRDVQKKVLGDSLIGRINTYFAVKITQIVGSMWCAYVFVLLTLISLPAAIASHNTIVIVSWIAQTFLQLVLLPIIIVGQNVQAAATDERAKHDHDTLNAIHTLTSEIYRVNEQQNIILDLLKRKDK